MMTLRQLAFALRRRVRSQAPRIVQAEGRLPTAGASSCFVAVCGRGFDQRISNAVSCARLGWCRGFEALGVPYRLVATTALARELDALSDPLVWIACTDHAALDRAGLAALARRRHAVLVDPAFDGAAAWFARHGLPPLAVAAGAVDQVLATRPRFVFTIAAPSGFAWYDHWQRAGARLESLPLACDVHRYAAGDGAAGLRSSSEPAEIVFVGGFWRYKARQFALYLKPYASRLTVYGWAPWPYGRYGGALPSALEGALYRSARLSPVINEPHVSLMGIDINERVFKVLGAGGMALTDATPAYHDWFAADELMVPRSVRDYRALADAVLAGEIDSREWRRRGQAAVLARHTYRHRAAQFRTLMRA